MHRRTDLPFSGRFSLRGHDIDLRTNSPVVLSSAVAAGLTASSRAESPSGLQWEIVAELPGDNACTLQTREVVRHARSIYLGMGPYQWFAFDRDSGVGAGFVTADETDSQSISLYLRAVIETISGSLRHLPEGAR